MQKNLSSLKPLEESVEPIEPVEPVEPVEHVEPLEAAEPVELVLTTESCFHFPGKFHNKNASIQKSVSFKLSLPNIKIR